MTSALQPFNGHLHLGLFLWTLLAVSLCTFFRCLFHCPSFHSNTCFQTEWVYCLLHLRNLCHLRCYSLSNHCFQSISCLLKYLDFHNLHYPFPLHCCPILYILFPRHSEYSLVHISAEMRETRCTSCLRYNLNVKRQYKKSLFCLLFFNNINIKIYS